MTTKENRAEIRAHVQRAARLQDDPNYSDGEIYYPDSDDEPMAENEHQAIAMHYAFGALRVRFRNRDDVYVFKAGTELSANARRRGWMNWI